MALPHIPSLEGNISSRTHLRFFTISARFDAIHLQSTTSLHDSTSKRIGYLLDDKPVEALRSDTSRRLEVIVLSHDNQWKTLDHLYVMIIGWRGDVAEKLGLATIEKDSLRCSFPPGPQWKAITLG